MLLGLNSFKTIVAEGNFPPETAHRQTEGNVTLLVLKLSIIFEHFSKVRLTYTMHKGKTYFCCAAECMFCVL